MRVLFVSASKYLSNSAEAARLFYLAELFSAENEVCVISRGSDKTSEGSKVKAIHLGKESLQNGPLLSRALDYCCFTEYVRKYIETNEKFDAIVICAMPTVTLRFLMKYAERNQITLIHDAVEWYSAEEFKLGKMDRLYRKKELWMRKLLPGHCNVIAISHYLEKYFRSAGNKCVYIPSMIDTKQITPAEKNGDDLITIVYAGSPLKKDYLGVALEGISMLPSSEIASLRIIIMGITREQAEKNGIAKSVLRKLGASITFLGRVPREVVFDRLRQADFSVLLRPAEQRYAKAGFPTKVPESMACGTPVICNYSSDLQECIIDGVNGVVVSDCSPEAMAKAMRKLISLPKESRRKMAESARITAERRFDYRLYLDEVRRILE